VQRVESTASRVDDELLRQAQSSQDAFDQVRIPVLSLGMLQLASGDLIVATVTTKLDTMAKQRPEPQPPITQ